MDFQTLKTNSEGASKALLKGLEPSDELTYIRSFLHHINEDGAVSFLQPLKDGDKSEAAELATFVLEDMGPNLIKKMCRERSSDRKYLELCGCVLEEFLRLMLCLIKNEYYPQDFLISCRQMFDYDCYLHRFNYTIPEDDLQKLFTKGTAQTWREELKEGDFVDALLHYYDKANTSKGSGWAQAKITKIKEDQMYLEYTYDLRSADRIVNRWSTELAPFESKTKENYEWRTTLKVDDQIDAQDDMYKWLKATIVEISDIDDDGKTFPMCLIGMRVYVKNGTREDSNGRYDGYSAQFDEKIPLYSPRLAKFMTLSNKTSYDDDELDETLDDFMKPVDGHARVWAVPRPRKCVSSEYIRHVNMFCELGGLELIMDRIENAEFSEKSTDFNLCVMAILVNFIILPSTVYHKSVIADFAARLIASSTKRLLEAPDKALREVRKEHIEAIVRSIDVLNRRVASKNDREKQNDVFKLQVALLCIKSSFMAHRIQGIKDLNKVLKGSRVYSDKTAAKFYTEWMKKNDIFEVLFDPKKTHAQLVQRCDEIVKLLLQEDQMDLELFDRFWQLTKTDLKSEVFKIISDCSFYFLDEHLQFIFEKISQDVPIDKLELEEFNCLCELAKYSKAKDSSSFQDSVTEFFWKMITSHKLSNSELIEAAISKIRELVKTVPIEKKFELLQELTDSLKETSSLTYVPLLQLYKGILTDQNDRTATYYNYSSSIGQGVFPPRNTNNLRIKGSVNLSSEEVTDSTKAEEEEKPMTFEEAINLLLNDHGLIDRILENFSQYCKQAEAFFRDKKKSDRKKVAVADGLSNHHTEVDERLSLLRYLAQSSEEFCITRRELGVIYDLLVTNSSLVSDQQEFLIWCKSSCELQTKNTVLDLQEVGEFITEKIQEGTFNLRDLSLEGFHFLASFFVTINEKAGNIEKVARIPESRSVSPYSTYKRDYMGSWHKKQAPEPEHIPKFKLLKMPSELVEMPMIWTLVLDCQEPDVVAKAIDFLIQTHLSLPEDLQESRLSILKSLIGRCMTILESDTKDPQVKHSHRVIEILKNLVHETETRGAGNVVPHGALTKGEQLEPFRIKNKDITLRRGELEVQAFSNTTLWDLKKEIAEVLDFNPIYIRISKGSGTALKPFKDSENGKSMTTLGLQGGEQLTAEKVLPLQANIKPFPLISSQTGDFTPEAQRIFLEWHELFSDENGNFTKESGAFFVQGCCGDLPPAMDGRITNLFHTWDSNHDGILEKEEFCQFYRTCSNGEKENTVRDNLRAFNVRLDLKKWSDVFKEDETPKEELLRYFISTQHEVFDHLFRLVENENKEVAKEAWSLTQMLCTNVQTYQKVLSLEGFKLEGGLGIDWEKFFDKAHSYRLLYTLQIVQAVLDEGQEQQSRAQTLNASHFHTNKIRHRHPAVIEQQKSVHSAADKDLRRQWLEDFINYGGFSYVLQQFMNAESNEGDMVQLQHTAFQLNLLRTFIVAAFSNSDHEAFEVAQMGRKTSSTPADPEAAKPESSGMEEIQSILKGPLGLEIVEQVDYKALQEKVLSLTAQTLAKDKIVFEDKLIIENALNLWIGCCFHRPDLFTEFTNFSAGGHDSKEFILSGLLYCQYDSVRESFRNSLSALCSFKPKETQDGQTPLAFLIRILSENFNLISKYQCQQFFELLCELLDQYYKNTSAIELDSKSLLSAVIDSLREQNAKRLQSKEEDTEVKAKNDEKQASLFEGLINLAGRILDNLEDKELDDDEGSHQKKVGLVQEIFSNYLFPSVFQQSQVEDKSSSVTIARIMKEKNAPKGKSSGADSKKAAFKLIGGLLKKDKSLVGDFLVNCLEPLMKSVQRPTTWCYTPPSSTERFQDFVGLRNLGCICYMNSMLQQFFMIPAFRYNLLAIDDGQDEQLKEVRGQKIDDTMLHQLQKLMATLTVSDMADYNPWEFCYSFKDFDGSPTNIGEQKDTQEFLNMLLDRVEQGLKHTSRKHLLRSIFGGTTCSQLICNECGKVKNRIEDFYNLSLTVKGIKSMQDSLTKLISGEVINEYECSGCKKKVDINKRTLIANTPNVLIIHLQRIVFNFDTFQNDKLNDLFEFPQMLDLKPYSYWEIMNKEKRLEKKKEEGQADDDEEAPKEDDKEEEKKEDDEDNVEPKLEDCFEYRLTGVTVHSGSANAGHYWSLINAKKDECPWVETKKEFEENESERWMEFNDSQVKDFSIGKMKDECFGGDSGGSSGGGFGLSAFDGWGFNSGGYGKSGYILFYEKKVKKPLEMVKTPAQAATETEEAMPEEIELVDFEQCVQAEEKPGKIFQSVLNENQKFSFESDVYSSEFFKFVGDIQKSVFASTSEGDPLRLKAFNLGVKTVLDILARSSHSSEVEAHLHNLAELIKGDASGALAKEFLLQQEKSEDYDFSYLFDIIIECPDLKIRAAVAQFVKYVLVTARNQEKDYLGEGEEYTVSNDEGQTMKMERCKAISCRFINQALILMNFKVARNFMRFEQYFDILYGFAFETQAEVEAQLLHQEITKEETEADGQQAGLDYLCSKQILLKLQDFMMGKKSPMFKTGINRPDVGGSYTSADLKPPARIFMWIFTNKDQLSRFPMSDQERQILLMKDFLRVLLQTGVRSEELGAELGVLCRDKPAESRRVIKVFLQQIDAGTAEAAVRYIRILKPFLQMDDSLKQEKLEWVFGVPCVNEKVSQHSSYSSMAFEGVDSMRYINELVNLYFSPTFFSYSFDSLITMIIKVKGRNESQCIHGLIELLEIMKSDEEIADYIFNLPAHNYQNARFVDWIRPYLAEVQESDQKYKNSLTQSREPLFKKIYAILDELEPFFERKKKDQEAALAGLEKANPELYEDLQLNWPGMTDPTVVKHFPVQLILGKEKCDKNEVWTYDENPHVTVKALSQDCDYSYSAPTGIFNLQVPHLPRRQNYQSIQTLAQYAALEKKKAEVEEKSKEEDERNQMAGEDKAVDHISSDSGNDSPDEDQQDDASQKWENAKKIGPIFLKFLVEKKQKEVAKVWVRFIDKSPADQPLNIRLPKSKQKVKLLSRHTDTLDIILVKIDPTKDFFADPSHIGVELEVITNQAGESSPVANAHNIFLPEFQDDNDIDDIYLDTALPSETNPGMPFLINKAELHSNNDSTDALKNDRESASEDADNEDFDRMMDIMTCSCGQMLAPEDMQCSNCGQYNQNQQVSEQP